MRFPMKQQDVVSVPVPEHRPVPVLDDHVAARSGVHPFIWGILAAGFALMFCLLSANALGIRFILGWIIGVPPIRLVPLAAQLGGAVAFAMMLRSMGFTTRIDALPNFLRAHWRQLSAFAVVAGITLSLVSVWVLRGFPNSSDEYDYLFQAQTFLAGRLWNPAPPLPDLFAFFNQWIGDGKWFSVYSPGWPLLLAAAIGLQLPAWLASPILAGGLLLIVLKLGLRRDGPLGAFLAVALLAVSPFFLFNAGSYFSHLPAAVAGLLFCWAAAVFLDRPAVTPALLSGMALGAVGLIRPVDAPIFALPFVVEFLWRARIRHYCLLPVIGAAGLLFLVLLLLYNHETLGSAVPSAGSVVRFGLSSLVDDRGHHLTLLDQLGTVASRLVSVAEWTSPLLVLGLVAAYVRLIAQRRLSLVDLVFPSFVAVYLLIPLDGGAQYGPRYYFEGFPFLVLTLVSGLSSALNDTAQPQRTAFAWFLVFAHGVCCLLGFVFISFWMRTLVDQRMDMYDQVREQHLRDAIVIIRSSTSNIYPMAARDLTRNGIAIGGPVIYVRDLPDRLDQLRRLFPERRFYIYERDRNSATGVLRRWPGAAP